MSDWPDYFSKAVPPSDLNASRDRITRFTREHASGGRHIVLITSGGTTVPIESNTVRFLDNFSQGTRGACSAEYFLAHNYAVIFLHRIRSYEPFLRHFEGGKYNVLDLLQLETIDGSATDGLATNRLSSDGEASGGAAPGDNERLTVDETRGPPCLRDIVRRHKRVERDNMLLKVGFTTLSDYLFLLKASAEVLSPLGVGAMFYLAAAVSDFYIPAQEMHEHKIQSSAHDQLSLQMQPTPKMLSPLVKEWAPHAYVVSFKLETDVNIIARKAREAITKYNHQVVIANILHTRRHTVVMVTRNHELTINMSRDEIDAGKEIEEKMVAELCRRHGERVGGTADEGR